jgi:hypothetical protein
MNMRKTILLVFGMFVLGVLSGQPSWEVYKKTNEYTIWLKNVPGQELKQFKKEAMILGDIQTAYKILKDVQNMHLWYDKVKKVSLLKTISDHEGIYLLEYDLPFPFEDRIATVRGKIDMAADKNSFTVETKNYPFPIPADKQKMELITTIYSSWKISEINNSQIKIIHEGYMNPGGNVPVWLTNESITSGPPKTLSGLKKMMVKYQVK